MRKKQQKQMPLMNLPTGHPKEIELEMMSKILDKTSTIYDHVLQDLNGGLKVERHRTGGQWDERRAGNSCRDRDEAFWLHL